MSKGPQRFIPLSQVVEEHGLDRDAFHEMVAASGTDHPVSPLFGALPVAVNEIFPTIDE